MLCVLADALAWSADNLLAPALTGVFVGLALRWAVIPGEVNEHDARAEELNTDLTRWVADRERQLVAEIFRALNLARQGIIEDVAQPPVPKNLKGTEPGSQEHSGALVRRVERLMRHALHEYRDDASGKVRIYRAMARSEGRLHELVRRRRSGRRQPVALRLSDEGRETLATWRERQVPTSMKPTATVEDDPTRHASASDIAPLEQEDDGLTWEAAKLP
jgi:hypothetical protein